MRFYRAFMRKKGAVRRPIAYYHNLISFRATCSTPTPIHSLIEARGTRRIMVSARTSSDSVDSLSVKSITIKCASVLEYVPSESKQKDNDCDVTDARLFLYSFLFQSISLLQTCIIDWESTKLRAPFGPPHIS